MLVRQSGKQRLVEFLAWLCEHNAKQCWLYFDGKNHYLSPIYIAIQLNYILGPVIQHSAAHASSNHIKKERNKKKQICTALFNQLCSPLHTFRKFAESLESEVWEDFCYGLFSWSWGNGDWLEKSRRGCHYLFGLVLGLYFYRQTLEALSI